MYQYDDFDRQSTGARCNNYREQTERYLAGKLSEDEFRTATTQRSVRAALSTYASVTSPTVLCPAPATRISRHLDNSAIEVTAFKHAPEHGNSIGQK